MSDMHQSHDMKTLPAALRVAHNLAMVADVLPGFDNSDRERLRNVADLLVGVNPNAEAADAEAWRGVRHAIRPGYTEQRPETWLLCAVAVLLRAVDAPATSQPGALPIGAAHTPTAAPH